ncbi:MAG: beta-propeller domain-containing protein [bacterium]
MLQKKLFVPVVALTLMLAGCTIGSVSNRIPAVPVDWQDLENGKTPMTIKEQLASQSKIKKFENLDELQEFLENNNVGGYAGEGLGGGGEMIMKSAPAVMELGLVAEESSASRNSSSQSVGNDDFSKTNIQVEGVDEADIVKTDGKYIYTVSKNNLFIVSAVPADKAEIISKIEFKSTPQDIYINGDNLVVFGYDNSVFDNKEFSNFIRRSQYTFFKVFDISDKKNPKQVRNLNIEGGYTNSRMIGDYVYFVTANYNYYYIENEPLLPRIIDGGVVLDNKCASGIKCFNPNVYYFDLPYQNYNFTTVLAINVVDNKEEIKGDEYLMSYSQNMYVSSNNIYITYTKYISEYELESEVLRGMVYPKLNIKDQEKITAIEKVDNFILNKDERRTKIRQIIERYISSLSDKEQNQLEEDLKENMKMRYEDIAKELEKTVIHKIAINNGSLEYKTFGEVSGNVLNQFSMNEDGEYFMIATTKSRTWSRYLDEGEQKSYSNVYVLDNDLKIVGSLEGLAPDERIYSARFMQDRAYLVTFKQTDPLFVIDLSNPENPKVLGELKVPGFSQYLHPYDDNTLIGFGKDTGETEWGGVRTKGLKLTLFDVSDVKNPKEIDTYVMGDSGSDSSALYDHKAFLFSKEKNLLSVPVTIREGDITEMWSRSAFLGAAVFQVDKTGFKLKGKISHASAIKRSLYIGNTFYTVSDNYIKMNNIEDLKQINSLGLVKQKQEDFEIVN